MQRHLFLLAIVSVVLGCAGSQGFTLYGRSKIIEADYDRLVQATADYLAEGGYEVKKVDAAAGTVETEYRPGIGWTTDFTGDKRAKIMAKVTPMDSTQSKLTLEILSEVRDPESGWQMVEGETRMSRVMYERIFEGITARAQGRSIR